EPIGLTPIVAPAGPPADSAERRQVTVMFADLVGSTALSARMDPEDLREVISAYQKCAAEAVRRFGGFVARYMGDGVLVYFGYPEAHEDDAERAVRAGLELITAVIALKTTASLQTRVSIATGLVVVGDLFRSGEAQERGIVGKTPNLAARLQEIAEPNTVVIDEATRSLLGNLFELRGLGARDLKGVGERVRAWVALRASTVESRFEALHPSGLVSSRPVCCSDGACPRTRPICSSMPSCRTRLRGRCCASRDAHCMPASPKPSRANSRKPRRANRSCWRDIGPTPARRRNPQAFGVKRGSGRWRGRRWSKPPSNLRGRLTRLRPWPARLSCVANRSSCRSPSLTLSCTSKAMRRLSPRRPLNRRVNSSSERKRSENLPKILCCCSRSSMASGQQTMWRSTETWCASWRRNLWRSRRSKGRSFHS